MSAITTICEQCGGAISWIVEIDRSLPNQLVPCTPPLNFNLCLGHPKPATKHDGRLDDREDDHQARVTLQDNYFQWDNTKIVSISGGHGDIEASCCYLDPAQALSLLAWLRQEEETLKKLVGGGEA
jgi:hypothetical protein